MLQDALRQQIDPRTESATTQQALDQLLDDAALQMTKESGEPGADALSAEEFRRARTNLQRMLKAIPSGIDDPLPRSLEKVRAGTFSLCPLWPFC